MRALTIAIDVDDVVLPFTKYLCKIYNRRYLAHLIPKDFTEWDFVNFDPEVQTRLREIAYSFEIQPLQLPTMDSLTAIHELIEMGHRPFFATAVPGEYMAARMRQLNTWFPGIPVNMGAYKELLHADILIDDKPSTITKSHAKLPIYFDMYDRDFSVPGYYKITKLADIFDYLELVPAV